MKILFLGFSLTPYFRDFCSHLNATPGVSVLQIQPSGINTHLGEAVHETTEDIDFASYQLDEVIRPAKRIMRHSDFEMCPSYPDFPRLPTFVREHCPDIIVIQATYHAIPTYSRDLALAIEATKCKLVFHSIPFNLEAYANTLEGVHFIGRVPLHSSRLLRLAASITGIDRLYARFIRNAALKREVDRRRKVFCRADAHVVYHEEGISIYTSWGVPADRIHVVRNSPDTDKLIAARTRIAQQLTEADRKPDRAVHVGRLIPWKRVDLLIRSIARLRARNFPNASLLVVGYGPCEAELRALAKDLNVLDAVEFLGGLYEPDDLARCFLSSSVYVLAGMGGLSLNEAMTFGLPVICSRCDGTEKFLVRDGCNGLYFREGNLDDLTEKIAAIFADAKTRREMGERSRRIIEEEINIHILIDNYLAVFRSLLGERASGKRERGGEIRTHDESNSGADRSSNRPLP